MKKISLNALQQQDAISDIYGCKSVLALARAGRIDGPMYGSSIRIGEVERLIGPCAGVSGKGGVR
jgi:hypothetical protein